MVTISEHAWRAEGSRTFVQVGSQVPAEMLIKGMIVQSGNDATIALAERVGGTEAAFVQLMNEYAKRLGMTNTHFDDSTGLPSPTHYTTAHDLSLLGRRAGARLPRVLLLVLDPRIRLEQHQAAESQRPARARSDGRWHEDRPYRQRRLLPGDLGQARRTCA